METIGNHKVKLNNHETVYNRLLYRLMFWSYFGYVFYVYNIRNLLKKGIIMTIQVSKEIFFAYKKHLDGWVFWRLSEGQIIIRQARPNDQINSILRTMKTASEAKPFSH